MGESGKVSVSLVKRMVIVQIAVAVFVGGLERWFEDSTALRDFTWAEKLCTTQGTAKESPVCTFLAATHHIGDGDIAGVRQYVSQPSG
jgi:hypothetical protein